MTLDEFKKVPVLGILRDVNDAQARSACEAAIAGGLKAIEISLTNPTANFIIQDISVRYSERIAVGAGTVMSIDTAKETIAAGATFVVSPTIDAAVADYCSANNIPYFPGVMTPTEIALAIKHKPTMIKLFPAALMGPGYVREMLGPFPNVQFMAVGGVTPANAIEFFAAGAKAIGFGKSVFTKELIEGGKWEEITAAISQLTSVVKAHALV
jgi:2-dehydro-3-deoxyphosphogluconate aldolase/(4S)-4-hydroxy-2-oxoglutarate aldolase